MRPTLHRFLFALLDPQQITRDNLPWGQRLITNELRLKLGLTTSGITTVAHGPMRGIG